jgi:hypothetical protein
MTWIRFSEAVKKHRVALLIQLKKLMARDEERQDPLLIDQGWLVGGLIQEGSRYQATSAAHRSVAFELGLGSFEVRRVTRS